jgi:hypothetical protein
VHSVDGLPTLSTSDFRLSSPAQPDEDGKINKGMLDDATKAKEGTTIFCIDISGSMATNTHVPDILCESTAEKKMAMGMFVPLRGCVSDKALTDLRNQHCVSAAEWSKLRQGSARQYITRLDCMKVRRSVD